MTTGDERIVRIDPKLIRASELNSSRLYFLISLEAHAHDDNSVCGAAGAAAAADMLAADSNDCAESAGGWQEGKAGQGRAGQAVCMYVVFEFRLILTHFFRWSIADPECRRRWETRTGSRTRTRTGTGGLACAGPGPAACSAEDEQGQQGRLSIHRLLPVHRQGMHIGVLIHSHTATAHSNICQYSHTLIN